MASIYRHENSILTTIDNMTRVMRGTFNAHAPLPRRADDEECLDSIAGGRMASRLRYRCRKLRGRCRSQVINTRLASAALSAWAEAMR